MTNHPAFGCSQGRTNGELPLARCTLGQQQVGHIRARNEQHQADHGKQRLERRAGVALDCRAALRAGVKYDLLIQKLLAVFPVDTIAGAPEVLHLLLEQGVVVDIDSRLRLLSGHA